MGEGQQDVQAVEPSQAAASKQLLASLRHLSDDDLMAAEVGASDERKQKAAELERWRRDRTATAFNNAIACVAAAGAFIAAAIAIPDVPVRVALGITAGIALALTVRPALTLGTRAIGWFRSWRPPDRRASNR